VGARPDRHRAPGAASPPELLPSRVRPRPVARCCPRRAGPSPRRPACVAPRCRHRVSRYPLPPAGARRHGPPRVPVVLRPAVPAGRAAPVRAASEAALVHRLRAAARARTAAQEPVVGLVASVAPLAARVVARVGQAVQAVQVVLEVPAAVHSSAIGAGREAGALPVVVVATSRSWKLRRSPITRRRTLPFPRARSSSSGVRPRRSWVPSSIGPGRMWCVSSFSRGRWLRPPNRSPTT